MPSLLVSSTSAWLVSSACARLSSAQGPAIRTNGRSLAMESGPTSTVRLSVAASVISRTSLKNRRERPACLYQPALLDGGTDEIDEQRMRVQRLRLQLRVELHADKPGVTRQLNDFGQRSVR